MDNTSQEINLKALFERTLKKKWRLLSIAAIAVVVASVIIFPVLISPGGTPKASAVFILIAGAI